MDPKALTDCSERRPIRVETGGLGHVRVGEFPYRWSSGNAVSFEESEDSCAMDSELLGESGDRSPLSVRGDQLVDVERS
jgi:hypothetical protein